MSAQKARVNPSSLTVVGILSTALLYPIIQARFALPAFGGGSLSFVAVAILVVVARVRSIDASALRLPLTCVVLWAVLALANAIVSSRSPTTPELLFPAVAGVVACLGASLGQSEMLRIVSIVVIVTFALVLTTTVNLSMFAYTNKQDFNQYGISLNALASIAALPLIVCVASAGQRPAPIGKLTWMAGLAGLGIFALSGSRSVLPALIIAVSFAGLTAWRNRPARVAMAAVLLYGCVTYVQVIAQDLTSGTDLLRGRTELWQGAIELIKESGLHGLGADGSYVAAWAYGRHPFGQTLSGGVHNWVLQLLLAYGAVGLVLIVVGLLAYTPLWRVLAIDRARPDTGLAVWASVFVLARGLVESDGGVIFLRPSLQSLLVWLVIGQLAVRTVALRQSVPDSDSEIREKKA